MSSMNKDCMQDLSTLRLLNQTAHSVSTQNETVVHDTGLAGVQAQASYGQSQNNTLFENSFAAGQYDCLQNITFAGYERERL